MGRISTLLVCAAALLTVCAVSAAGALGAEYGHCKKAPHGAFADSGCTEAAASGHYEWVPVGAPGLAGIPYRTATEGVQFKTAVSDISCLGGNRAFGNSFNGELLSPSGGVAKLVLRECAGDGSEAEAGIAWHHFCSTAGNAGHQSFWDMEIPLRSALLEGGDAVEDEYSSESSTLVAINCGQVKFRVTGTFSGVVSEPLDEMSKTGQTQISAGVGSQDLEAEYSQDGGASWEGPVAMTIDFECGISACFPIDETTFGKGGLEIRR